MKSPSSLPKLDDQNVLSFCEELSPGYNPIYVPVRPSPKSKINHCFPNVENYIRRKKGKIVYGWEISNAFDLWLESQFHAIWESPEGELIDISPEHSGRQTVLFLKDPHRKYDGIARAPRRFAMVADEELSDVWFVSDLIQKKLDILTGGMPTNDPYVLNIIQPLTKRYKLLISKLTPLK